MYTAGGFATFKARHPDLCAADMTTSLLTGGLLDDVRAAGARCDDRQQQLVTPAADNALLGHVNDQVLRMTSIVTTTLGHPHTLLRFVPVFELGRKKPELVAAGKT